MKKACLIILCFAFLLSSYSAAAVADDINAKSVIINEAMASNDEFMPDANGKYSDWIELYNTTDSDIDLSHFYLSDGKKNLMQYKFGQGAVIKAKSYIIVWCSGEESFKDYQFYTNFKISDGETVYLTDKDGVTIVDSLKVENASIDESVGRLSPDFDDIAVFSEPTPYKSNENAKQKILKPVFSNEAGFYTEGFNLEMSAINDGADIYYTLDGSEPNENSFRYTSPIYVDSRVGEPNTISQIPTNALDTNRAWKMPNGEVFKATVVRACSVLNGEKSDITTATYFVDKNILHRYGVNIASITTNNENLFDGEKGIYVAGNDLNYQKEGRDWERLASFEYFDKDGKLQLAQDVGIRIHGAYSTQFPQKSLRLYARSEYGVKKFEYEFFENNQIKEFDSLIFRNSGNDFGNTMFLDSMYQRLWKDNEHVIIQDSRPAVMFINGEYWGIANLREHYSEEYFQSYYGGDENNYIIAENAGLTIDTGLETDNQTFIDVANFAAANDMNLEANYSYVENWIDLDNMAAYFVAEIFAGNNDWPGNNVGLFRYNTAPVADGSNGLDGRWRFFLRDTDQAYGYRQVSFDVVKVINEAYNGGNTKNYPVKLFMSMLKSDKFKNKFLVAYCNAINTNLSKANIYSTVENYKEVYRELIEEHIARWGSPANFDEWEKIVDRYKTFGNRRAFFVENQLKALIPDFTGLDAMLTLAVNNTDYGSVYIDGVLVKDFNDYYLSGEDILKCRKGKYFDGAKVSVKIVPNEGYAFTGYMDDKTFSDNEIEIDLKSNDNKLTIFFETVS